MPRRSTKIENTFVLSDIHLTTAEPKHPTDPTYRRFKHADLFIDDEFEAFIATIVKECRGSTVELVLAGDIFDFDSVRDLPETHRFRMTWLERKRGLHAEDRKSRFKMKRIIEDHPVFFRALKTFLKEGHLLVFIIGNHDLEMHWMNVQKMIAQAITEDEDQARHLRFCSWFYVSNQDTLVEHGNQYDSHNACQNPVNPFFQSGRRARVRLPFGSLAHRYMLNGMGYFNPHSERTYIMSAWAYVRFALGKLIRREPLLMVTWFWGAVATLLATLRDGIRPELKDPLRVEEQIEEIAEKSNVTPREVRALRELHAPGSFTDPLGLLQELWLDRAFVLLGTCALIWQIISFVNWVIPVSYYWSLIGTLVFIPFFVFYFRQRKSKLIIDVRFYENAIKLAAGVTKVNRVIFGHTHKFAHENVQGIEHLNSGTWSPAFDDLECTRPTYPKTFVWIRPGPDEKERIANVFEWKGKDVEKSLDLLC